ncbi:hypothetical protein NBRC116493_27730 [Aurantivibrio infirmus]
MEYEEFVELVAKAISALNDEIRATQVAQQLFAIQISQMAPEHAEALANTMVNIATSDAVKSSEISKHHLLNVSELLKGNIDTPIIGLNKPDKDPKDPLHWLQGVIDGGKK